MSKLKAPLIIAGATCLLSMLIGLVSGVQFITMLGRGLIAGCGAGGFVFLAQILLQKFIPDLFTPPSAPETPDSVDTASGTNVNITLDDESEQSLEGKEAGVSHSAAASQGTAHTEPGSTGNSAAATSEENSSTPEAANTSSPASAETAFSPSDTFSVDSDMQNAEGLSDLPDMDAFMEEDEDLDIEPAGGAASAPSGFSMEGIQTNGSDTKVMARAISTILATED